MPVGLLELFRVLSSFDPAKGSLRDAPWDVYADWAIAQGLGPLAAYNLEYRLGPSAGVPQWVKDRLLSVYQGSVNDNVMKLVGFKRSVDALEGRRVVLFGGATFAESLYPHVAFRPVIDLHVFVPKADVEPFVGFLRGSDFKPTGDAEPRVRALTDGRTTLSVHHVLPDDALENDALLRRAEPMKVYGPSLFRFGWEDALLVHVLELSRAGFAGPLVGMVDLRELLLGAPFTSTYTGRALDEHAVRSRAKAWGLERAVWVAMGMVERLFPQTAGVAARLRPDLSLPVRELLERAVVTPACDLERRNLFKGEEAVRALLAGG